MAELLQLLADPKRPVSVARRIADENIRHASPPNLPHRRWVMMVKSQALRDPARRRGEGKSYMRDDFRQRAWPSKRHRRAFGTGPKNRSIWHDGRRAAVSTLV